MIYNGTIFQSLTSKIIMALQRFPSGSSSRKSLGVSLQALGKPRPSRLFYLDLHSISKRFTYWPYRRYRIGLTKIYRWFHIGPPKKHRRFFMGPHIASSKKFHTISRPYVVLKDAMQLSQLKFLLSE